MPGIAASAVGKRESVVAQVDQAEVRRQLGNRQLSYDDTRAARDEDLALAIEEDAHDRLPAILRLGAASLLVLGQSQHVLDRDSGQARRTFSLLGDWLALLDACDQAAARKPLGISYDLMLEPVVCALLSGDGRTIERFGAAHESIFGDPSEEPKANQARCQMVRDVMATMRGGRAPQSARPLATAPAGDLFASYASLLPLIVAGDARAFESARARLEEEYPSRKKLRDKGLNWYGAGAMAQSFTFDALGTALCHLAVRRGMRVDVDSALYPKAFIGR